MPPTHLMGMEFTDQDGDTATVNLAIGQEDGKWYEAQPCPTEAGMERFAKLDADAAATSRKGARRRCRKSRIRSSRSCSR